MLNFGVTEQKALALEKRMEACGLREGDLEESFVRSSGPGGQHVNKTATCVILTHKPSASQVKCQDSRSQLLNRYHARKQMCKLLEAKALGQESPEAKRLAKLRKQKNRRRRRRKP
ncbi:peptide chain release factor family protein [Planctomycetota bacterium]